MNVLRRSVTSLLLLSMCLSAQTLMSIPRPPTVVAVSDTAPPPFAGLVTVADRFNRIYIASQPKAIRDMMALPTIVQRRAEAERLASSYRIDREIMVEGGTGGNPLGLAYQVNLIRIGDGLYAVPALKPGDMAVPPAQAKFDTAPYQNPATVPPNSIKVSIRESDYPQSTDIAILPRPFSRWPRIGIDCKAGTEGQFCAVGSTFPASDQVSQDAYGAQWPDPSTGAIYEKIFRVMSASSTGSLNVYVEYQRVQ